MWKSTGFFAKKLGVTRETIVNYIKDGHFERYTRTKKGHYRIWLEIESEFIGYCRVSSSKQQSSLDTQEKIIKEKYPNVTIKKDIGSGFNFKRKEFKAVLERALTGNPISIVATTQDRICRTGFPLIKWIIELYGGKIELLEETNDSEGFDSNTFISFITSFINSYHGKRSHSRKQKNKNLSE